MTMHAVVILSSLRIFREAPYPTIRFERRFLGLSIHQRPDETGPKSSPQQNHQPSEYQPNVPHSQQQDYIVCLNLNANFIAVSETDLSVTSKWLMQTQI